MLLLSYHQLKKSTISIGFMTFTSFPNGFNCKANIFLVFVFFLFKESFYYYFLFQITFFKKKQIPTYPDKIHDRGNYTKDRDSTQYSVFSVPVKSTTTDTMLHLKNEWRKRNLHKDLSLRMDRDLTNKR